MRCAEARVLQRMLVGGGLRAVRVRGGGVW